ncbi:AraC family transcriptional regulator [Paenibacillus sinopodophylli]|uniref:AraC family transcriptional regulator n=1 Tax=Paenibacillus sinopodophylli TaxID=1837342 RepID=UPI00110CD077|nr:AraC family transcriptional regulator [Paenibacillus sinopodophylli]
MNPITRLPIALAHTSAQIEKIDYYRIEGEQLVGIQHDEDGTLLFWTSGEGLLENNGARQSVQAGSVCMIMPNTSVWLMPANGETTSVYALSFKLPAAARDLETMWLAELSKLAAVQVIERIKTLYGRRLDSGELEKFRLQMDFHELLYLLIKDVERKPNISQREALLVTARYMEQHYHEPLSRDMLAGMAGMSAPYYSRAFKKAMGKTPQEYWTGIRLNQARKALILSSDKIGDIAEHTGFGEPYYFSRIFRQTLGISPTIYQKQERTRIACLYPPFIDAMLALGVLPIAYMIEPAHPLYMRLTDSVHLGHLEAGFGEREASLLAAVKPEYILCSDYIDPYQETLMNRMAPVLAVTWRRSRREDLLEIARILGKLDQAAAILTEYERQTELAREQLSRQVGRRTVALLRFNSQQLRLYGGPSQGFVGPILYGDLGLQAPSLVQKLAWRSWWAEIELSQLAELDTEFLLIVIDPGMEQQAASIMRGEIWSKLAAVRNGQVHQADYYTWMSSGLEMDKLKITEALQLLG